MARRKNRGARADAAAVLAMVRRNASPRLLASDPYNGLWGMDRYSACDRGEK